jgi:hypothetical protein
MPKYDGTQVRNRTLINVINQTTSITSDNPAKISLTNKLVFDVGPPEYDSYDLVKDNTNANLRPRGFNRTPIVIQPNVNPVTVRFYELFDEAIRQANEARYNIVLTISPGGSSNDEIT